MTQSERTLKAMIGQNWQTLRGIEALVKQLYGVADTQAAISARLREYGKIAAMGYKRERKIETINGKRVYFYRLKRI